LEDSNTFGIDWEASPAVPDAIGEVLVPEVPPALQDQRLHLHCRS